MTAAVLPVLAFAPPATPARQEAWPAAERTIIACGDCVVTAYAAPCPGDGRFHAYAKVCRGVPGSYWDAPALLKLAGEGAHATASAALDDVLDVALMSLRNLGWMPAAAS